MPNSPNRDRATRVHAHYTESASGELPRCLTLDMTKRILSALAAISFVLLVFAAPRSAQERQIGDRPQQQRKVMSMSEAESLRNDLIAAYDESEALIRFLGGYSFIRQGSAMKDYELVCQDISIERAQLQQMSITELVAQAESLPSAADIGRLVKISQRIRTDLKFQKVLEKVERYSQAGLLSRNSPSGKWTNSREVIASPAYIAPNCDFSNPSNYPSGVDIGIAKGIALALHTLTEAQPSEFMIFCLIIPNPFRFISAVAAGIVDQVVNALEALAKDGAYCEAIRLYVEEEMSNGLNAILMNDNYYLTFTYNSVKAALAAATATTVPTNCGSAQFMAAQAYFDGSGNFTGASGAERVIAYKLLRNAYLNIGASACVQ
ncbi:MAG TPA: hypothetical protein PLK30_14475 [Blastocatellia bacterium]|nr:hypothetical protein [Blastocatellia bacterium]